MDKYNLNFFNRYVRGREGKEWGGIFMFVKQNYFFKTMEMETSYCELLAGEIEFEKGNNGVILSLFRPPDKSIPSFLEELKDILKKFNNKKS